MEKINNNDAMLNNKNNFTGNKNNHMNIDKNVFVKLSDTSGSFQDDKIKNISFTEMADNTILNQNNKTNLSRFKYSEYGKEHLNYLNISEALEENSNLKSKFDNLKYLKDLLMKVKQKDMKANLRLSELNTDTFHLSKIFADGMSEISKELMKIHELQLDKIISS